MSDEEGIDWKKLALQVGGELAQLRASHEVLRSEYQDLRDNFDKAVEEEIAEERSHLQSVIEDYAERQAKAYDFLEEAIGALRGY